MKKLFIIMTKIIKTKIKIYKILKLKKLFILKNN